MTSIKVIEINGPLIGNQKNIKVKDILEIKKEPIGSEFNTWIVETVYNEHYLYYGTTESLIRALVAPGSKGEK